MGETIGKIMILRLGQLRFFNFYSLGGVLILFVVDEIGANGILCGKLYEAEGL